MRIAELGVSVPQNYYGAVVWNEVDMLFQNNALFNRRLRWNLAHHDLQREYPHYCVDAAIAGDMQGLGNVLNAYTTELGGENTMGLLNRQIPVDGIECTCEEINIIPQQAGDGRAWARAVMEATRQHGSYNEHIRVKYPRFNSRADEDVWLNCVRNYFNLARMVDRRPRLLDILYILAREGGPLSINSAESPAIAMIDLILKPFLHAGLSGVPRLTYSSLCGPVDSSTFLIDHIWAHDAGTIGGRTAVFMMLLVRTIVTTSVLRDKLAYISDFPPDHQWKKMIRWLLNRDMLRPYAGVFLARAVSDDRLQDVARYMLQKHAEQLGAPERKRLDEVANRTVMAVRPYPWV